MVIPTPHATARTADEVEHDWRARGYDCELTSATGCLVSDDEICIDDQIFLVMEGRLQLDVDGELIIPDVGEEVRVPAGAMYSVMAMGGAPCKWLRGCGNG